MNTWQTARSQVQRATALMSCFTNALLITLIIHKSPKTFGAYRYLMVYMSLFELGYAMIDLVLRPEVITKGTYWLCVFDSNLTFLPFEVQYFGLLMWCGAFGISLANFGVHFLFRYLVVTGEKKWTSSKGFRMWVWYSASIIYGCAWSSFAHFCEKPTPIVDDLIQTQIEHLKKTPIREVVYVGFSFFKIDGETGERVMNETAAIGVVALTAMIMLSFVVMTVYGSKCYLAIKALADQTDRSSRAKSLQTQLFFALVLQASIPIILMHFPCGLVQLSTLFDATKDSYGNLLTITIALFPAIDPLPSVFVIEPYRKAVIGKLLIEKRET